MPYHMPDTIVETQETALNEREKVLLSWSWCGAVGEAIRAGELGVCATEDTGEGRRVDRAWHGPRTQGAVSQGDSRRRYAQKQEEDLVKGSRWPVRREGTSWRSSWFPRVALATQGRNDSGGTRMEAGRP